MKKIFLPIFLIFTFLNCYSQTLIRDISFGNASVVNTNYNNNDDSSIGRTFILSDNKFFSLGKNRVIRFNENGTLDTNFGLNGTFTLPNFSISVSLTNVFFKNGFFYMVGNCWNNSATTYTDAFIAKVDYSGNLDTTFGNNGVVIYNINEEETFSALNITSDNKIIAVGIKKTGIWQKLFLARFNSNGTIDSSYQTNGYKEIYVFPIQTIKVDRISEIENGKFYIAVTGRIDINEFQGKLALVKIDIDGNLDLSFNTTGKIIFGMNSFFGNVKFLDSSHLFMMEGGPYLYKINLANFQGTTYLVDNQCGDYYIHPDGSVSTLSMNQEILNPNNPTRNLFIKKYTPNGTLDNGFSNDGIHEFNLSDLNNFQTDDVPRSINVYNDKILIGGISRIPLYGNPYFHTFTRFSQVPLSSSSFNNEEKLSVFPNPVQNTLNISAINIEFPVSIEIFNLLGQLVQKTDLKNNTLQIDVSQLEANQYLLKITDNDNIIHIAKFLKK